MLRATIDVLTPTLDVGWKVGGGASQSRSRSTPQAIVPQDIGPLRNQLAGMFQGALNQGFGALTQPQGVIGSTFANLFGPQASPAVDFLGARAALERGLSGEGLQQNIDTAFGQLQPTVERQLELLRQNVQGANAPLGTRFSSDVQNQVRAGTTDITNNAMQAALGAALQQGATQTGAAGDIFSLIAQLGEAQAARQLPLIAQFASAFAPVGQRSSSRSGSFNFFTGAT